MTAVWGPQLWKLLHSIGSHGISPMPHTRVDAARQLKWLFDNLERIIPCRECELHTREYKKKSPLPDTDYKKWVFDFHNSVNIRLRKPIVEEPEYPAVNILEAWRVYTQILEDSLLKGRVKGDAVKDFGRHLRLWASFSGL